MFASFHLIRDAAWHCPQYSIERQSQCRARYLSACLAAALPTTIPLELRAQAGWSSAPTEFFGWNLEDVQSVTKQ
jgi:hypothetical protein